MYALIKSTNRRNKEPKNKDHEKSRNNYNETKQNQGQKIIKHKKTQNTKNHKRRTAWRSCCGEAAMYCPRVGLAYCVLNDKDQIMATTD